MTTVDRDWTIEQEIKLFSLVCDYKPAGADKNKNMAQIVLHINEELDSGAKFTPDQIWAKLAQNYDLQKVEAIEGESESDRDSATPEAEIKTTKRRTKDTKPTAESNSEKGPHAEQTSGSASIKEEKSADEDKAEEPENAGNDDDNQKEGEKAAKREKLAKDDNSDALETGAYSSELSDVEGEDAELAKLGEGELLPTKKEKATGRGRRKSIKKLDEAESTPRKRTRSIAKLDTTEGPQTKRRQLRAGTPPTTVKRRTRSEFQEEEPAATPIKEEPKTRRSTRQAVRRSARKK